jgi:hypothetical protein
MPIQEVLFSKKKTKNQKVLKFYTSFNGNDDENMAFSIKQYSAGEEPKVQF